MEQIEDHISRGPPPGQLEIRNNKVVRVYDGEVIPVTWKEAWEYLDKNKQVCHCGSGNKYCPYPGPIWPNWCYF